MAERRPPSLEVFQALPLTPRALHQQTRTRHDPSFQLAPFARDPDEQNSARIHRLDARAPVKENFRVNAFKRHLQSKYFTAFQYKRAAEIHEVEDYIMNVQLLSIALAAMSIFLAMAEQELSWKKWWDELPGDNVIDSFPNEYVRDDLKQTNTAIVFLLLLSIVYRYSLYFRLRIRKTDIIARGLPLAGIGYKWNNLNRWPNSSAHSILHFDSCIWHPRPFTLVFEILVCAVVPLTNFHRIFYIILDPFPIGIFRLESAMVVVMFLRAYLLLIYVRDRHATSFRTSKERYDACSRPINSWFILRSLSNQNPGLFVLIFYLLEHILFTYVWRLAVIGVARKESPAHVYYWNNWWLLQFSITTVGYGDMTPQGTFGRVIFIPTVFGAVFLDSLMTGTLVNIMGLTCTENAILQLSVQAQENSEHRNAAARYMSAWIRWWLKADGPSYERYVEARERFRIAKRSLHKRRNEEFHDPDAATVTLLLRWPFDDALDMLAFRLHLHTAWRLNYAKTKIGILSAIELRLQNLEEQFAAMELILKRRKLLRARAIQMAMQKLLGGVESLDTAAALVREVGAGEMQQGHRAALQRGADAADAAAIMSDSDQGDYKPFSAPDSAFSSSSAKMISPSSSSVPALPIDVMQPSSRASIARSQTKGASSSKLKRRTRSSVASVGALAGAPVFC